MLKKRNLWGQKLCSTQNIVFILCWFSHLGLNLKLWKKVRGFFLHFVQKSVESPGKYVQYLSGVLLLRNQNTNRRLEKALLFGPSLKDYYKLCNI